MNHKDLKEVIEAYIKGKENIKQKELEIEAIKISLPKVSPQKDGSYSIDSANQLFQGAMKIEELTEKLHGIKDDHEAIRINLENLLKKIPEKKVDIGNSYFLVFEKGTDKLREGNDTSTLN